MLTVEEFMDNMDLYTEYLLQFGHNVNDGGTELLESLEIDPGIADIVARAMPTRMAMAGFMHGFTLATWLWREKRGL